MKLFKPAIVTADCKIGKVIIYAFCNIYNGTVIGDNSQVGAQSEISGAIIGRNVRIGNKCFIPKGVTIENDVFVGPGVFFTHSFPPATVNDWKPTLVKRGAKIGANVTIKEGLVIGENATVGCGAVVTKDIPAGEVWVGNPCQKLRKRIKLIERIKQIFNERRIKW